MSGTHVDTEEIDRAEARIAEAVSAVQAAVDQLNAHTQVFQAAAGSDSKNGGLKQQSAADGDNKQQQCAAAGEAAQQDQEAARAASAQYTGQELDNSASFAGSGPGLGGLVGFE